MNYLDQNFFERTIRKRKVFSNKYTFGNVLIYGGSPGKWGASILSSRAALRAGSGLVTTLINTQMAQSFLECCPEVMHLYTYDFDKIKTYDSIGMGSGLGQTNEVLAHLTELLKKFEKPMVLDADALNLLANHSNLLSLLKPYHVLTPHFGEAARLFGQKLTEENALELGLEFVKKFPCTLVLKGPHSKILTSDASVYENTSGNDALATAGSGDVLTGIITSFLGKNYSPTDAASLGVYVHGCLADNCIEQQSKSSVIASDLIEELKNFDI